MIYIYTYVCIYIYYIYVCLFIFHAGPLVSSWMWRLSRPSGLEGLGCSCLRYALLVCLMCLRLHMSPHFAAHAGPESINIFRLRLIFEASRRLEPQSVQGYGCSFGVAN